LSSAATLDTSKPLVLASAEWHMAQRSSSNGRMVF